MLTITIDSASELRNQFAAYDRDGYTYEAYEYFIENLDGELDVICICCDWEELDYEELIQQYAFLDECEDLENCADYLNDYTFAIVTDNKILFQVF